MAGPNSLCAYRPAQLLSLAALCHYDFNRPIESIEPVDWLGLDARGAQLVMTLKIKTKFIMTNTGCFAIINI